MIATCPSPDDSPEGGPSPLSLLPLGAALKPKSQQNVNNTTEHSTKADIITAALEITDTQAAAIDRLEQRQLILWAIVGVLTVTLALKG